MRRQRKEEHVLVQVHPRRQTTQGMAQRGWTGKRMSRAVAGIIDQLKGALFRVITVPDGCRRQFDFLCEYTLPPITREADKKHVRLPGCPWLYGREARVDATC